MSQVTDAERNRETSPADAAASAALHEAPAAQVPGGNVGAARGEEHGAPAPSPRIGPKLWIIAALAVIAVGGAIAFA